MEASDIPSTSDRAIQNRPELGVSYHCDRRGKQFYVVRIFVFLNIFLKIIFKNIFFLRFGML